MSTAFAMRALEINAETMWRPDEVDRALRFAADHGMNMLVFHDGDIMNRLVFPRRYFPPFSPWGAAPPRRGENAIYNARAYLRNLTRKCRNQGIQFLLEVKELAFPDEVLELHPELVKNGTVCPTEPFWAEFIETRYREMCEDFVDLAGFIVSVGSPEGRATLASKRCECEGCRNAVPADWHRTVVSAIDRAVRPFGRRLVIREFSYSKAAQDAVIESLSDLPEDIDYCVKPYARDYYMPWPDNPALPALTDRRKWVEYDVHGQYYGWGILPCAVADDIKYRFDRARANGASGILLRTDWERVNGLWAVNTFSRVNLAVAAYLGLHPDADAREALTESLRTTGLVDQALDAEQTADVAAMLSEVLPIVNGTMYTGRFVYNNSSTIPNGVEHAWWHMAVQNDLAEWDPSAEGVLDLSRIENVEALLAEKDAALAAWTDLLPRLRERIANGSLRLPDPGRVGDVAAWADQYLTAFAVSGIVVILAKALEAGRREPELPNRLEREIDALERMARSALEREELALYSHHIELLMGGERMLRIAEDARRILRAAQEGEAVGTRS